MARILVIDDEHNVRMMVRLALRHAGHEVQTATDGAEGLGMFGDGHDWDVVLLDQRMPGVSGLEALGAMRERDPRARVIMITAFGTIDLAVEAMRAGATDFLRKPFTTSVLCGAVDAALKRPATAASAERRPSPPTYVWTTLNGFRIETAPGPGERMDGGVAYRVTVQSPTGERRQCTVRLPDQLVERVRAHADRRMMPGGDRFWQALSEEVLANYLWQHADFAPAGLVEAEELTGGLKRWVDAVLTEASTGGGPAS